MKLWVSRHPYCFRTPTPFMEHLWRTNTVSEVRHGRFINLFGCTYDSNMGAYGGRTVLNMSCLWL